MHTLLLSHQTAILFNRSQNRIVKTLVWLYLVGVIQATIPYLPLPPSWQSHISGLLLGTRSAYSAILGPLIFLICIGVVTTVRLLLGIVIWALYLVIRYIPPINHGVTSKW